MEENMNLSLDLDTTVLQIRDQSENTAWTDQYPDIEILTGTSKFRYESLERDKERRYKDLINSLTFEKPEDKSAQEMVRDYMKNTNIFMEKADYFNLKYNEEKKNSPLFSILFLVWMGMLGLILSLKFRRKSSVH